MNFSADMRRQTITQQRTSWSKSSPLSLVRVLSASLLLLDSRKDHPSADELRIAATAIGATRTIPGDHLGEITLVDAIPINSISVSLPPSSQLTTTRAIACCCGAYADTTITTTIIIIIITTTCTCRLESSITCDQEPQILKNQSCSILCYFSGTECSTS